ncbi:MAG TPA: polysaccharide lyase family protein [Candidatus Acidoferrum sp.]|nr:polysaccharide lyase family protein [Candidatus Acidoferrum sp.]
MSLRKTVFVIAFLITACAAPAKPQEVWRIGKFDGSSAEFAGGSADKPVTYAIGRDEPGKFWFAFAPTFFPSGKENATNAPRSIQFEVKQDASSSFRLRV